MKHKLDIFKFLLPALMLSVASCVTEDIATCPEEPEQSGNWITLQFYVSEESPVTRANPLGGEDGNGREDEILNEARIHDVNIFLFADNAPKLLNAASNTTLTHLYFNLDDPGDRENTLAFVKEPPSEDNAAQDNSRTIYTVKFLDEVPGIVLPLRNQGTVRFITVANVGHSMKDELTTNEKIYLENLWNYNLLSATWTGTGQDVSDGYDRFVMTTAYDSPDTDSYISFSNANEKGTESDPFRGKTTLQRMCARIDVMYDDNNLKTNGDNTVLKYEVPVTVDKVNTVYLLNMLPVNVMSSPSYLFKKVTDELPDSWRDILDYTWGGKESVDDVTKEPNNYVLEPNTLNKESYNSGNLIGWYKDTRTEQIKIDIQSAQNGAVGGYYHGNLKSTDAVEKSYTKIAVLGYANENTQSPNQFNSSYLTGIAFRAVYVPAKIEPSVTQTTDKPTKIYRYSPSKDGVVDESKSLYFSDMTACIAYQNSNKDDMADITEYDAVEYGDKWGFVCYYNLWLKHYDDVDDTDHSDPHSAFPMQYATVRNNIYRVALKFNGPGDPTPTMREPETMQARIFVRKWNQRTEKYPLQF